MPKEVTLTMYQIAKELALENQKDFVYQENGDIQIINEKKNVFDNYRKDLVKKLKCLLDVKGVDVDDIKEGGEYAIPLHSVDYIKFLLNNYTNKSVKQIRDHGLTSLSYTQWSDIIQGLVEYSTRNIEDVDEKIRTRNRIFAEHQYFSLAEHHSLIEKISKWLKDVELRYGRFEELGLNSKIVLNKTVSKDEPNLDKPILDKVTPDMRVLSENDVLELYKLLEKKIFQCFIEFGDVVTVFNDIRNEEIEDKVLEAITEEKDPDKIELDSSKAVLDEVLKELKR